MDEKTEASVVREAEYTPILIRDMQATDRPREKMLRLGAKALKEAELMALLFGTGIKGKSVIELCTDILRDNDWHLSRLAAMSPQDLCARYKGIGIAKATTLVAALQLGMLATEDEMRTSLPQVLDADTAYQLMRPRLARIQHEEFWVMLLNRAGRVVDTIQISKGGTAATCVDVKIIMKAALGKLASAMLLFHNHPSGTLRPSPEDDALTRKITDAAAYFDLRVHDHLIITDAGYYSYHEHGKI